VKRNKSCGCLRADRWHEMLLKKKPKLIERQNNPFWEQFCNKGLGPAQIIGNALKSGVVYHPDLRFLKSKKRDVPKQEIKHELP